MSLRVIALLLRKIYIYLSVGQIDGRNYVAAVLPHHLSDPVTFFAYFSPAKTVPSLLDHTHGRISASYI